MRTTGSEISGIVCCSDEDPECSSRIHRSDEGLKCLIVNYFNRWRTSLLLNLPLNCGISDADYTHDFGGTSASTPKVAAVVALLLSENPNLTPAQVKSILRSTADDIGDAGFDDKTGYGRVNAYDTLAAVPNISVTVSPDIWLLDEMPLSDSEESGTYTVENDGNVTENFKIKAGDGAGGWQIGNDPGLDQFKVEVDKDDNGSYEIALTTTDQTLYTSIGVNETKNIGFRYSSPTQDTKGGGVDQGFVITITASTP